MKIAVGNSRMDKKWKNRDISWEDLCQRVSSTIRTTETVEEYRKLKKGAQDNIKDVGGFVGGQLREGRRKTAWCSAAPCSPWTWTMVSRESGTKLTCFTISSAASTPPINTRRSIPGCG